jgi:leader peptidase (prepilin peptidase)/N-methyltransferase
VGDPVAAQVATVLAYGGFAVQGIILSIVDIRTHRLPNRIVLPGYPVALVLLGIAAVVRAEPAALLRAVVAGAVIFGIFLALRLAQPGGMGGGDVKLAGLVGVMLGFAGWAVVAVGLFAAFVGGGLYSILLLVRKGADRRTAVPFGPWMLLGAWIGLAVHLVAGG